MIPLQRAKATLFDISDLAHPRDVGTVDVPRGLDRPGRRRPAPGHLAARPAAPLLTVVGDGYGGRAWVSVLTLARRPVHDRLVAGRAGDDVAGVRTVPLRRRPGGAGRR